MLYGIEWGGTEMQNTLALGTTAGTVQLWDVAGGGRGLCSWADPECSCIGGMSWYGHSLAVGRSHGDISIFDARQQSEVRRVKGHKGRVNALKFSHDGKYIGSGDESGGVYIWDARACKSLSDEKRWGRMKHSGPVRVIVVISLTHILLIRGLSNSLFPGVLGNPIWLPQVAYFL
jgi:WD40 repeat protein